MSAKRSLLLGIPALQNNFGAKGFLTKPRDLRNLPLYVVIASSFDHPMSAEATGA